MNLTTIGKTVIATGLAALIGNAALATELQV